MFRLLGYLFGIGTVAALVVIGAVAWYVSDIAKTLPDVEVLASYEPAVTTRVYAGDGELMSEYAKERRLYLPIQAIPERVKQAFISAEDKNFYDHPGIDATGIARAMVAYAKNYGKGVRAQGASTITQQVAKNFLLSNDRTIDRKVKEAILAFRIESAYPKDEILELYLNEIFFGLNAYGIAGASLSYFDKPVSELKLHEAAYLAGLIKGPNNYHPFRNTDAAIGRRNYVIDRMVANSYVTVEEGRDAKAMPLDVRIRERGTQLFASEYFAEEVRRQLIATYGEEALYEGGLSVRTTIDPEMQRLAREALHKGLIQYDQAQGFRGPVATIGVDGDWGVPLAEVDGLDDIEEWRLAVVLSVDENAASIGLQPEQSFGGRVSEDRTFGTLPAENMKWAYRYERNGERGTANSPASVLKVGDVVYVEETEEGSAVYRLRQPPSVQGGMVVMEPQTGRVLAMVGGFSFSESEFNRATQAMRQPGSAFKPFVYAAALDNGYTPASVINDAPIRIVQNGEIWEPKNYAGGAAGPSTLRSGIEKSRNLMTVRLARDMGMGLVSQYAERFGLYEDLLPVLPMSLGSGETTVMRMVGAYAVMANGGKQITPSLIDRIQNRYGQTIFKHGGRACPDCRSTAWTGQPEPEIIDTRQQVLDPMTAYQITSMMQGVASRGTAAFLRELGRPVAGKTGTTNDEKDAWFVGYTPDLVAGIYIGFDTPRPMGKGQTGGGLAAPIFQDFMAKALEDRPVVDFPVPSGMTVMAIDRRTGMASASGAEGSILEAFKPGTGPATAFAVIGLDEETVRERTERAQSITRNVSEEVLTGAGGLY